MLLKDDFALTRSLRQQFAQAGFDADDRRPERPVGLAGGHGLGGLGVALLPEPFIDRLAGEPLAAVRIVEPELAWQVAHIWNGHYLSHAARAWLAVCQEVLGTQFEP